MDKISIIVPVFNTKEYLRKCFDSIKNQTYSNIEIIFVNDGSTDDSLELLRSFEKEDKRVVIVDQENKGLSAARNAGVKKATGDYLSFLDSDDFLAEDAIEYLYKMINKDKKVKISVCSHIEYYNDKKQKVFNSGYKTKELSIKDGLDYMLNEKGFNLQSTAKLYERSLFNNVLFPEGMLHEDVGTTYKLFLNAFQENRESRISYGAKAKYFYRMREGSIIKKKFDKKRMDLVALTDIMCDEVDAVFDDKLKDTTMLRRLHARFSILRMLASNGRLSNQENEIWKEQKHFIMEHKDWIKNNPEATRRDKTAYMMLKFGRRVFGAAWKIYDMVA